MSLDPSTKMQMEEALMDSSRILVICLTCGHSFLDMSLGDFMRATRMNLMAAVPYCPQAVNTMRNVRRHKRDQIDRWYAETCAHWWAGKQEGLNHKIIANLPVLDADLSAIWHSVWVQQGDFMDSKLEAMMKCVEDAQI